MHGIATHARTLHRTPHGPTGIGHPTHGRLRLGRCRHDRPGGRHRQGSGLGRRVHGGSGRRRAGGSQSVLRWSGSLGGGQRLRQLHGRFQAPCRGLPRGDRLLGHGLTGDITAGGPRRRSRRLRLSGNAPGRGRHAERRDALTCGGLTADRQAIHDPLHARRVLREAHGGSELLLIGDAALQPDGARFGLHVDAIAGQGTRLPQLRGHGARQILGPRGRQPAGGAYDGHDERRSQNGHAWTPWIGSAAADGSNCPGASTERTGADAGPVPNSFRRPTMPKGSFFPMPTEAPRRQAGGAG
jgi:hypothetical protein